MTKVRKTDDWSRKCWKWHPTHLNIFRSFTSCSAECGVFQAFLHKPASQLHLWSESLLLQMKAMAMTMVLRDFLFDQKSQRLDVLPNERLLWEHITRAPTEVALVHVRLEFVPKIDRGGRVPVFQKKSEVFHDCVCVVVRLQKPVCLVLHHVHYNLLDQVSIFY